MVKLNIKINQIIDRFRPKFNVFFFLSWPFFFLFERNTLEFISQNWIIKQGFNTLENKKHFKGATITYAMIIYLAGSH